MEVTQIATLVNGATQEILGETAVLQEDLSNVVDIGNEVFNADAVDKYVKSLVNHIGRVIFVDRKYAGSAPSVLRDSWEFGSVLEKISTDLLTATENESWELEDGAVYEQNIFYKPSVTAKFYNEMVTFEIPISITEMQVKQSFSNAEQLNAFVSMIYNAVENSMTVKIDSLVMRTINTAIAETISAEYEGVALNSKSGVRAVNLLKLYNDKYGTKLTAEAALTTPEFIRFAAYQMGLREKRLSKISRLFNVGGKARFTPQDLLHVVMLADFVEASKVYLQSDTWHKDLVALPNAETVPYWQGTGDDYGFDSVSKINVKTPSNKTVTATGVLGIMFDRDAIAVCNENRRTTSHYNGKAEFTNYWFKSDGRYLIDLNENIVVFFIA